MNHAAHLPSPRVCLRRIFLTLTIALLAASTTGCGPAFGAWLYTFELYPAQKIAAQFELPKGSYLVLVDDDKDLIRPSTARGALVDEMAKRLKEHEVSEKVTTNEELARLRQKEPKFDQRGARELGEMANAETVLWIKTMGYDLCPDLEMLITPGRWAVTVMVLKVKATEADKVRLWPQEREGKLVGLTVSAHDIRKCKSMKEAHELMAIRMADDIAKLFYEQQVK